MENRCKGAQGEAKIAPRVTLGAPKSVPGVPRGASEKQVATKTRRGGKQSRKWLPNGSQNRKVGDIFDDIFRCFSESFLGCILNGFFDGFGIDFCILFMLYLDVFGYPFETS